jgi:cytochrome c biogenesis protein CcdA
LLGNWRKCVRKAGLLVLAILLLSAALAVAAQPAAASSSNGVVELYIFNNPNCGNCRFLDEQMLPELKKQYGSKFKPTEYQMAGGQSNVKTFGFMVNLEDMYGRSELDFPQVYIGTHALIGVDEVRSQLPGLVSDYIAKGGVDLPVLKINGQVVQPPPVVPSNEAPSSAPQTNTSASPVYIAYFYKAGCRQCDAVSVELDFLKTFGNQITVREYDLSAQSGILMNEAMCIAYGIPRNQRGIAPALFVGHQYLHGKHHNRKKLTEAINAERQVAPPEIPWEQAAITMNQAKTELKSSLKGLSVLTVIGAGLVDGLNPCALTVIVFLVAYLAFIGRTGKDTLYVGAAISIMAFLTYLLVGLGALSFIRAISRTGSAGTYITAIVASLTAVFGILSIYDYARSKRSGTLTATAGLSKGMTQRIHRVIREHTKTRYLVLGAAVIGILITVFELGCTGQVYLPVITFVAQSGGARAQAVLYLVLFSIMSTLPLVVVFLLAYFGTSNEKMAEFGRKHTPTLTLLGGVAMLVLAVILFATL